MLAALLAAGLSLAPAPASAPAPAVRAARPLREALRVEPGATCLTLERVAEAIEVWLGSDAVDKAVTAIEVRGDPTRAGSATIRIEIRGDLVERPFEATHTCAELHAVVGLAIAIAIDSAVLEGLGYEVIEPGETTVPQAQERERPPLTRRRKPEPLEPPRRVAVGVVAAARGGVWLGVLPGVAGGGGAQLELSWRGWVDLRLGLWGGYGGRRAIDADTAVTLGMVAGRVDVCAALARPRLRPRLCFGPAAGAVQIGAKAPGVRDAIGPWAALVVGPELRIWATRRFALDLLVDLVVPVVRPVLAVRDPSKPGMIGDSIAVPPVGAVVGLGGAFTIR